MTTLHSPNKPAMEVHQHSLPVPYAQSSRTAERPLPRSQEYVSHGLITSCLQNKQTYMQSIRIPEKSLPPSQDVAPDRHTTTQHVQSSLPFAQTSSITERTLPFSQGLSLHPPTTTHSQNKLVGPDVQESCSSQPYPQTSKFPERSIPLSKDHAPPIIIEDELSASKGQEEGQMEDFNCSPSLDPDKLSHYDYTLPKFPADIMQKLENGVSIEAKDRSTLLDILYESVVPYTYYPSSSDYIFLIKRLLERFPQLIPQAGPKRDCPNNWEAWRQKLMHKFQNKRKRQDRDAPGVLQHKRMNCTKHFEGLDELHCATEQSPHDRGDLVDDDYPGEADDEVFEVVDDEQDVLIKEEDSMYHVGAADTTNLGDPPDMGVVRESLTYPQTSRIPEKLVAPFQDHQPYQSSTLHLQSNHVMECVHNSVSVPPHGSRVLKRSLPFSQDDVSNQQTTSHLGNKPVMDVVQESCSSRSSMQTARFPDRSLTLYQDHSQDNMPNQQTMQYSQTQSVMEVEQQSGSSACYGQQTSKIPQSALPPSRDHAPFFIINEELSSSTGHEERLTEAQHVKSAASCDPDKPSLYDYRLPEFPPDIIHKLKNGIPIEAKDRSILLDALYESFVPYTYYPSAADYIYLTNIFLERYPQLLPQAGPIRDCPDNWEAWRQKLMHKFKNKRKRKDRDAPAVKEHTRKNFRYFEGLDELQNVIGEPLDERGDLINSDCPGEADDDIFEVVDDDQDIVIKEEDSMYHVVAADTTNLDDAPVKGDVRKSLSLSPYIQSSKIPDRNLPLSQDDAPYRMTSLHTQNKPVMDVIQKSCSSQPYMHTSRIQERTLLPFQEVVPLTTAEEDLSPSTSQREKWMEVQDRESAPATASDKPSLYDYKLPKFPADIIQKLERGIPIEAKDRTVLLDTLYESIVPYTYYPSASDYIYFTNIFLEQYPQLVPQAGPIRDCQNNWEAWRQKLMHKFKNKRKRKDRDAPAVREHTRKNFRYFEGLDEMQSSSTQVLDERGDQVDVDCPDEDDDEVFELMDDDQDVSIKEEEDSMYHVMAADTTNLGDI